MNLHDWCFSNFRSKLWIKLHFYKYWVYCWFFFGTKYLVGKPLITLFAFFSINEFLILKTCFRFYLSVHEKALVSSENGQKFVTFSFLFDFLFTTMFINKTPWEWRQIQIIGQSFGHISRVFPSFFLNCSSEGAKRPSENSILSLCHFSRVLYANSCQ